MTASSPSHSRTASRSKHASPDRAPTSGPAPSRRCPVVVLEGFLSPAERESLLRYVLSRSGRFEEAGVDKGDTKTRKVRRTMRRARVLWDAGQMGRVIRRRVLAHLPRVLRRLHIPPFRGARIITQISATNHGEFFRKHTDSAYGSHQRRVISYVYYFHREPRGFSGGELLLYPTWEENGRPVYFTKPRKIDPRQNRIIFFPSSVLHEIRTVRCPSRDLADSRFTVNGWVCF